MIDKKPVAWTYELAYRGWPPNDYSDWRKELSWTKPKVPDGSIRNLTPLYKKDDDD